jgi:hypothetical protein
VTAFLLGSDAWESPSIERRGEATARWVAETLANRFGTSAIAGLSVATADAGASESIDFWASAVATGLPYANPGPFPWTLANSPTGRIAQRMEIRGPTYTLVGGGQALSAAAGHAIDEVAKGIGRVLLVALDGSGEASVSLVAAEFGPSGGTPIGPSVFADLDDSQSATAALRDVIAGLSARSDA